MKLTPLGGHHRTPIAVLMTVATTLVVAGVALLVMALTRTSSPPQQPPAASAASTTTTIAPVPATTASTGPPTATTSMPTPTTASTPAPATTSSPPPALAPIEASQLGPSHPVRVDIPSIGVSSSLLSLGLNADGTLEVPPIEQNSRAGWYRNSPTPGQLGPAVIAGHVDSAEYGPGIFARLAAMHPGELVSVSRADNTVAVFQVQQVATYAKSSFPTQTVYGNTNRPALRLITCGGSFDNVAHSYLANTVVYADLISTHPAGS